MKTPTSDQPNKSKKKDKSLSSGGRKKIAKKRYEKALKKFIHSIDTQNDVKRYETAFKLIKSLGSSQGGSRNAHAGAAPQLDAERQSDGLQTHQQKFGLVKGLDPRRGIIVSFPSSGLNWLRYCIEHFTGLRTSGQSLLIQQGDLAVYRTQNVNRSEHWDSCLCPFYDEQGQSLHRKVILLLRDPHETLIRFIKGKGVEMPTPKEIEEGQIPKFRNYFNNLKAYDQFDGLKMLVHYPDLVSNFATVTRIFDFLDLAYDVNGFDLEYHRDRSLQLYEVNHKSMTRDSLFNFSFHANTVDADVLTAIDHFVDHNYKDLADRYLR